MKNWKNIRKCLSSCLVATILCISGEIQTFAIETSKTFPVDPMHCNTEKNGTTYTENNGKELSYSYLHMDVTRGRFTAHSNNRATPSVWDGSVADSFSAGNGTKKSPYQIATATELALLAKKVNEGDSLKDHYFLLQADIRLNEVEQYGSWGEAPPTNNWMPIGLKGNPFAGSFDGNGHTIMGLYINHSASGIGLFGAISQAAQLSDIIVQDVYVKNSTATKLTSIGGVVGINKGTVDNCCSTGNFEGHVGSDQEADSDAGNVLGAIVGKNYGTITNCHNLCQKTRYRIQDGRYWEGAGGIVGYIENGIIANCYNQSKITANLSNPYPLWVGNWIGGICGKSNLGKIVSCQNNGDITVSIFVAYNDTSFVLGPSLIIGGIIGRASIEICNSYNSGNISADGTIVGNYRIDSDVGGIAGYLSGETMPGNKSSYGKILNSYNSGFLKNIKEEGVTSCTGGLAGRSYRKENQIRNSFWLEAGSPRIGRESKEIAVSGSCAFSKSQHLKKRVLGADDLCGALNAWLLSEAWKDAETFPYYRLWEKGSQNGGYPVPIKKLSKKKQSITYQTPKIQKGKAIYGTKFSLYAKTSGNGKLSYKSSNSNILSVDNQGYVIVNGFGKASITIKASAATGYKAASKQIHVTVVPKQVHVTDAKWTGEGAGRAAHFKWKGIKYVDGYQVAFSYDPEFNRSSKMSIKKNSIKLSNFSLAQSEIYIRVRAYKKVGKIMCYGEWSRVWILGL